MSVLSEYEESYYGFLAVVNSTSLTNGITIDIGGGSTEITLFKNRKLIEYKSFPFGVITLKNQFFMGETPTTIELQKLRCFLEEQFNQVQWLKQNENTPIIGIGGSARNIVKITQANKQYPIAGIHQYEINREEIKHVKSVLTSLDISELQRIEGLSKDRADVIIPAIEVFNLIQEVSGTTKFILSKKGLREGVFYEELMRPHDVTVLPNVIEESFYDLALDFHINYDEVNAF